MSTSTSIPLRAGESRLDAIRAAAAARRLDALDTGYLETETATSADERARRITASLVADLDLALANDDGMAASTPGRRFARRALMADELVEMVEEVARAAARGGNDALAAAVGLDLDDDDESDLDDESGSPWWWRRSTARRLPRRVRG